MEQDGSAVIADRRDCGAARRTARGPAGPGR